MRKRIERFELNSCQFVVLLFYGYRRPAVASFINPPPEIERCSMEIYKEINVKTIAN